MDRSKHFAEYYWVQLYIPAWETCVCRIRYIPKPFKLYLCGEIFRLRANKYINAVEMDTSCFFFHPLFDEVPVAIYTLGKAR